MAIRGSGQLFAVAVIWTIFLIVSTAAFQIVIKPPGDKFVKPVASNAVFSCSVIEAGDSNIKIEWFDKDSRLISEDLTARINVEKGSDHTRKLYVRMIEERDAGKYSCSVIVDGVRAEKSVELFIFKEITFEHVPNPQHPERYSNALIACQVSGSPSPTVSWRFNGKPIEEGGRYIKKANGLMVKNITQMDNGNYTCRAEVEADGRYDERPITVIVHIGPSRVEGPGNIEGIEGQEKTLSCSSDGLPPPKYEFLKKNSLNEWKLLSSTDRVRVDSDFGQLKFRPLAKEDEGSYLCRALNDVGQKENEGSVKVFVPPSVQEIRNQTVDEGRSAVLICKYTGDPPPVMSFQKVGNTDAYKSGSYEGERIVVESRQSGRYELHIKKVSPSDSGSYVCHAHNTVGQHKAIGSISVRYKPRFPKDKSNIVYSWAGKAHNITCSPEGEPTPDISWQRMGTNLPDNDTFRIFSAPGTSILQIRVKESDQSWIYGGYICRAVNSLGVTNFEFMFSRASVPDAPQDVTVKEVHPNFVQLAIEPPKETGGVRLVGYRVEFNNKVHDFSIDDSSGRARIKNQSSFVVDVENLRPATSYTFNIRARNEVGVGNRIEKIVTTLNVSRPFPIHLTSSPNGHDSNTYKIMWEKPKTGGKPIKEYEIRYKKVKSLPDGNYRSEEDWKIERHLDSPDRPMLDFTLSGLFPNTHYKLEVLAKNEMGSSKPEKQFVFRTSALPQLGQSSHAAAIFGDLLWLPTVVIIRTFMLQWTGNV